MSPYSLLTLEGLEAINPETRLEYFERAIEFLHDYARGTDPLDLAAELRGFVLGLTRGLLS